MLIRASRSLMLALLFLLQGVAPLVHAHTDGHGAAAGIHLDGIRQLLLGAAADRAHGGLKEDESPSVGLETPRRNEDRLPLPVEIVAIPDLPRRAVPLLAPALPERDFAAARAAPRLLPDPRAPPQNALT
jgi:hypothetical protein